MHSKITFPVKTSFSIPVTGFSQTFAIANHSFFTVLYINYFIRITACRLFCPCNIFPVPRLIIRCGSLTGFRLIIATIISEFNFKVQSFCQEIQLLTQSQVKVQHICRFGTISPSVRIIHSVRIRHIFSQYRYILFISCNPFAINNTRSAKR